MLSPARVESRYRTVWCDVAFVAGNLVGGSFHKLVRTRILLSLFCISIGVTTGTQRGQLGVCLRKRTSTTGI